MNDIVLTFNDVSFEYVDKNIKNYERTIPIFTNMNLTIETGKIITIMGRSGGGKTTILNLMNGLLKPTCGNIIVHAKRAATVFQNKRLIPWISIAENVRFGANEMGIQLSDDDVSDALLNVGISPHLKDAYPKILSGGMQQRIALARALVCKPDILFLDEPFSALDMVTKNDLMHRVSRYIRDNGATAVFVTHQIDEACLLSDEIFELRGFPAYLTKISEISLPRENRNENNIQRIKEDIMFKLRKENIAEFTKMASCKNSSAVDEFIEFLMKRHWKVCVISHNDNLPEHTPDILVVVGSYQNVHTVLEKYSQERTRILWLDNKPDNIEIPNISNDFDTLKDWWGWENLYEDLIVDAPNTKIDEIVIGHNWSYVETKKGAGVGRTPCRGTEGARTLENAGDFVGKTIKELSQWLTSDDDLGRSVAIAALSSAYNYNAKGRTGETEWGFRLFKEAIGEKVCIGNFPPASKIIPDIKIVEREPKDGQYSVEEGEKLLQTADYVVVTAQTLMNGSLPRILFLAQNAQIMILGPTSPLSPVWKKYGVRYVCGMRVTDNVSMRHFTSQAGSMLMKDHMTEKVTIEF